MKIADLTKKHEELKSAMAKSDVALEKATSNRDEAKAKYLRENSLAMIAGTKADSKSFKKYEEAEAALRQESIRNEEIKAALETLVTEVMPKQYAKEYALNWKAKRDRLHSKIEDFKKANDANKMFQLLKEIKIIIDELEDVRGELDNTYADKRAGIRDTRLDSPGYIKSGHTTLHYSQLGIEEKFREFVSFFMEIDASQFPHLNENAVYQNYEAFGFAPYGLDYDSNDQKIVFQVKELQGEL